jgi:hypothetical protein
MTIVQLADTDNACGLPILLGCLNDERARLAIYALRTAIVAMEPANALKLLQSVPREKITVFKEVIRLAGDTTSLEAFNWLLELEKTELHRDVRVALLRSLWNYAEHDETWQILKSTVKNGDPVFAETAIRIPALALSGKARAQLLDLYNVALQSSDAVTRLKTLGQIPLSNILDPAKTLENALASCLSSAAEDECRAASWTIASLYAGRDQEILSSYLVKVATQPRKLRTYLQQLQVRFSRQADLFADETKKLCLTLRNYPKTLELSISLAGALLPPLSLYKLLKAAEKEDMLHFGVMQVACQCLSQPARSSAEEELAELERKLKEESSENMRRLGLAALCGLSNSASGWTSERLMRLREYREDASLLVASAADFTLPSAELFETVSIPD